MYQTLLVYLKVTSKEASCILICSIWHLYAQCLKGQTSGPCLDWLEPSIFSLPFSYRIHPSIMLLTLCWIWAHSPLPKVSFSLNSLLWILKVTSSVRLPWMPTQTVLYCYFYKKKLLLSGLLQSWALRYHLGPSVFMSPAWGLSSFQETASWWQVVLALMRYHGALHLLLSASFFLQLWPSQRYCSCIEGKKMHCCLYHVSKGKPTYLLHSAAWLIKSLRGSLMMDTQCSMSKRLNCSEVHLLCLGESSSPLHDAGTFGKM